MVLKLLQWNVWYKEDPQKIAETIRQINPDIACLQEIFSQSGQKIETPQLISNVAGFVDLNYKQAQSWHDQNKSWTIGNVILSKFPMVAGDFTYLQADQENTTDYEKEGRIYIETEINIAGKKLKIGTTHLSYSDHFVDTTIRDKEIKILLKKISRHQDTYILAGDFNSLPGSKVVASLESRFQNCGPSSEQKTWTTKPFEFAGFKENELKWRLDYVFATWDVKIKKAEIIKTQYSDHLPILVEFELP